MLIVAGVEVEKYLLRPVAAEIHVDPFTGDGSVVDEHDGADGELVYFHFHLVHKAEIWEAPTVHTHTSFLLSKQQLRKQVSWAFGGCGSRDLGAARALYI